MTFSGGIEPAIYMNRRKTILMLGKTSRIVDYLRSLENTVLCYRDVIPDIKADVVISYGFKHKIPKEVIDRVCGRCINLHISLLPWNRGANPNYWSFYDDTPKGVSIHYVDENFDTGDIIVQKAVDLPEDLTMRESYKILSNEIEDLFIQNWQGLFFLSRKPQEGYFTRHFLNDEMVLPKGWDTTGREIREIGVRFWNSIDERESANFTG